MGKGDIGPLGKVVSSIRPTLLHARPRQRVSKGSSTLSEPFSLGDRDIRL